MLCDTIRSMDFAGLWADEFSVEMWNEKWKIIFNHQREREEGNGKHQPGPLSGTKWWGRTRPPKKTFSINVDLRYVLSLDCFGCQREISALHIITGRREFAETRKSHVNGKMLNSSPHTPPIIRQEKKNRAGKKPFENFPLHTTHFMASGNFMFTKLFLKGFWELLITWMRKALWKCRECILQNKRWRHATHYTGAGEENCRLSRVARKRNVKPKVYLL